MNARALSLLIGAAIVLFAITYFASPSSEQSGDSATLLEAFEPNAVTALTIEDADSAIALTRSETGWALSALPAIPLDQGKIRQLLLDLSRITVVEAKTDDPSLHEALGLTESATRIRFSDTEGLVLGKPAAGGKRFAKALGADQTYVIEPLTSPTTGLKSWTKLTLPTAEKDSVTKVEVFGLDASYAIAKEDGKAVLIDLQPDESLAYDGVLDSVLGGAGFISFDDIKSAADFDWDKAPYSVFHGQADIDQIRYTALTADDAIWLRIEPAGAFDDAFDWPSYAFQITEYRRDSLIKPRAELIEQSEPETP
ncbi:MAG: DUF4340 domain-containing protein [Pseudomonadota bacterium]